MLASFHSSGDLIADRRLEHARGYAETGDFAAAGELMQQALELVPDWAAGWDLCGDYRMRAGDRQGAIAAWQRAATGDAAGVLGAALKLAAHGAAMAAGRTEIGYVEALFDQYAPRFEDALLGQLGYRVPELLADMLVAEVGEGGQFAEALDLGCGTGLMGERLRRRVSFLSGIDLSAAMVAETLGKGLYDRVEKAELAAFLATAARASVDLVTAADVFTYCGALAPVVAGCRAVMRPGALLAFSLEANDGAADMVLRTSLRYAHGEAATRRAVTEAGLEVLRLERAVLRQDAGAPIAGWLVLARRPQDAAHEPVVDEIGLPPEQARSH